MLGAVVLLVIVRAVRLGLRHLMEGDETGGRDGTGTPGPRTAAEWEALARRAEEEGRWRDAAMDRYQAVIRRLDEEGRVSFDPSKTPGDYRREVRDDSLLFQTLTDFVRIFEIVAFGRTDPDEGAYRRLLAIARPLARRGAPTTPAGARG